MRAGPTPASPPELQDARIKSARRETVDERIATDERAIGALSL
jgi:hypothetical protein